MNCSSFPAFFWPGHLAQRASARSISWSEGLVRLAVRWETEPEGWCVDHPYAVFRVGVNYSPLELPTANNTPRFVSIRGQSAERILKDKNFSMCGVADIYLIAIVNSCAVSA